MTEEIKRRFYGLKKRLYQVFDKDSSKEMERGIVFKRPDSPEVIEKRRKEAMEYWVKKYHEDKRYKEELERKLGDMGSVDRWFYKRWLGLKDAGMVVKEGIIKPVGITSLMLSGGLSILLGITAGPYVTKFTGMYIPYPSNYILDVFILFPIGFTPGMLSIIGNYYLERKREKRMLKNYGLEVIE
jgi:hypothetical protein